MARVRSFLVVVVLLVAGLARADDGSFNDISLGWRWGPSFSQPGLVAPDGSDADVAQRIFNLTWVHASRYGSDLLVADYYLSNAIDANRDGDDGAREWYVIYRRTLAPSGWTGNPLAFGPVRDTSLAFGIDLNTKDNAYAPRKRMLVVGPQFEFDVPRGFLRLAVLAEKEWDHNGIVGAAENFDATWALESAWQFPFALARLPLRAEGYLGIYGPKGRDRFGNDTRTETLFHPRLMGDVGALAGHANRLWLGLGYEYWRNKFGADHAITPGAMQHAWMVEAALHW